MTFLVNNNPLAARYFSASLFSVNNGLWSWGENNLGQLGTSNQTNYSSPVQVGALTNWNSISASTNGGQNTLAIQSGGTLWAWGNNNQGQLGLNTFPGSFSSPSQVGTNLWLQVSCGYSTSAIKNDGTLWAWGLNNFGQLGNGATSGQISPIQIGLLNSWIITKVGAYHTIAIQNNNTLWSWGTNGNGQLGLNTSTAAYSSPVQVGTLSVWTVGSAGYDYTLAIQSNGTLWAWGNNNLGQLGTSNTVVYSSPVQIGNLSTWLQVSCGYRSTAAIKTNGTLWSWGSNSWGQLGVNTSTGSIVVSPVQIGNLSTWSQVAGGWYHMAAVQNNGTLWSWGRNNQGQIGNNTSTNYSSPVQVGILNNWNSVACGYQYTASLQKP